MQKFKKQESFLLSWKNGSSAGDGRGSIWLSPNIPLYMKFLGGRTPEINKDWLLALGKSADSSSGLIVTNEDGELAVSEADNGGIPGDLSGRTTL